jgi:hypothetical protein
MRSVVFMLAQLSWILEIHEVSLLGDSSTILDIQINNVNSPAIS